MTSPAAIAGRKIFLNISSFQILTMFRRGLFYSYLSIYLRFYLGLSVTETTLFASLPMIANVVFQNFVWGRVSDRLQIRRTMIIIGELLAAAITFVVWYIHTIPESNNTAGYVIIIGLTVVEIFWSMSNLGWTALLSDLYPEKERAGLLGRMQSMGAAGRFIGVWIGGLLYDGIPFQYEGWGFHEGRLFFIACAVMVLSTIPMFFVPEGGVAWAQKLRPRDESDNPTSKIDENAGVSKRFMIFLLAMVCIYFGLNAIVTLKSQYLSLDEGFDISSRTLSYIVNTTTVAIFISGLFIKRLSDRFKDENLLMVGIGVGILYLIGYSQSGRLEMIYVSEALCGVSFSMIMASSYAYASRLIPAGKRGKQFAMYNATFFLSWGVPGTFIAGPLVDRLISTGMAQTGAYRLAFVASAAIMIIGAGILFYNTRMKNNRVTGSM